VSVTHSPSADARKDGRWWRRLRGLAPRSFQARLTFGFVGVVALTLLLVSAFVINRLDDYFLKQQEADLAARTRTVIAYVSSSAITASPVRPVVDADGITHPAVINQLSSAAQKRILADRLAQADVRIQFGHVIGDRFIPSSNGLVTAQLREAAPGQTRESITTRQGPVRITDTAFPYALEVTLSGPYTFRAAAAANVTGILAAIGLFALGLTIIVAAVLARRYTTPLRELREASRALAEGDLSSRVPRSLVRTGPSEVADLAIQFNAMAERLEESVATIRRDRDRSREFLADVSHELRTPIAALRMFNELIREHGEDDPAARAEFIESTAQQLDRLDWLAQNLLELSKLDSGLVLLDLRPDDLRAAVESAVEQARPAAERREVALNVSLPDAPIRIRHDAQRVGQVVANLVGNAIKFTPPRGSVAVEVVAVPDGARIEVSDTGVGIDPAELPRIFERFYRGSRANEARGSGSGLGLAIVRSIVDMHGGTVTVESRLGAGSRFTVMLPRDPRLGDEPPTPARAAEDELAAEHGSSELVAASAAGQANVVDSSPSEVSSLNPGTSP
jgi:signal transduction histidine kinase